MAERNYDSVSDLTMKNTIRGEGVRYSRLCFDCNRTRPQAGGSTSKKLKIWRCQGCTLKRSEKNSYIGCCPKQK